MPIILKPAQQKVLTLLQEKKNIIARLPTGYGKSLCYSYPAKEWGWKVLVISPLKALMDNQVHSFRLQGLRAITWHSGCDLDQKQEDLRKLQEGNWDLFLLSPEIFSLWQKSGALENIFERYPWQLIAVDEAHCAVDWKEFREAYAQLDEALLFYQNKVSFLALSASLDQSSREEIVTRWPLQWERVDESLGRDNLFLQIVSLETEEQRLLKLLAELKNIPEGAAAIVYCNQRRQCDELAQFLSSTGISSAAFHAELPERWKKQRSKAFLERSISVICSTTAFGLGIDAPHVEKIIHWGLPASIAEYWQQAGRAGRDGRHAKSILLWARSDLLRWRSLDRKGKNKVAELIRYCFHSGCRKKYLNDYFSLPAMRTDCDSCDRCKILKELHAWWEEDAFCGEKNFLELLFSSEKKY